MSLPQSKDARLAPLPEPADTEAPSLDPADWEDFRALCHGMVDELLDHLRGLGEGPVWRPVPDQVKTALDRPLPLEPEGAAQVCDDFRRLVLPYGTGNAHPRFFGWVHGSGTPGGMLAELLAGALNANLGGRDHGPVYVERQVIEWCQHLFGFPQGASGLLVSGTSMATLIGLTVARNHKAGGDVRARGLDDADAPLMAYASAEAHNSVAKALELLGLGRRRLRAVPVDAGYRIDLAALARMVARDRGAGYRPFCVIGTAGTVNTGAIDNLTGLAEIAAREGLWFHVDGAFGAAAMLSDKLRHRLAGLERADSLAFDFHKWLHVPYDAGCVLVRRGELQRAAFSSRQDYLASAERGLAGGDPWFCEYGPELSRGFRALKVWFTLKEHGLHRLGAKVEDNCRQARDLAAQIEAHPELELMAPVTLNIVCFRYRPAELPEDALDRVNGEIVVALQEQGIAAPSTTRLEGALAIRVNITNHRSRQADFDALLDGVLSLGARHIQEPGGTGHIDPAATCAARAMIEAACRRPELRPLRDEATIEFDPDLAHPFEAVRGDRIRLGPAALADPAGLAVCLRHAFELALLQRLTPGAWSGAEAVSRALFACRTTARYGELMAEDERTAWRAALPDWLCSALDLMTQDAPWTAPAHELVVSIARLLPLQGETMVESDLLRQIEQVRHGLQGLMQPAGDLATPVEGLLVSGGDGRLALDPVSGWNGYGCPPRPRSEAICFASSTASSISEAAYDEVEGLRRSLIAAAFTGDVEAAYADRMDAVKVALLRQCGAVDLAGVEAILAASGTDAELYALSFALAAPAERLINIVIAPDETGSGVVQAAGGQHFSAVTPGGRGVEPGALLAGLAPGQVRVETVAARAPNGSLKPVAEIDRAVADLVTAAREGGAHCLVHVLDAAKTGWGAPSLALLRKLSGTVDVVVDACQMRAGPEALRGYLEAGFMVQVTGSKFFGGPPFSGALLLPPKIAARAAAGADLPAGLADYAGRAEWPRAWQGLKLPARMNLGLLARWTAAICEMRAFSAVPRAERARILAAFGQGVQKALSASDAAEACIEPIYDRSGLDPSDGWDRRTTIFPFLVYRRGIDGARIALSFDEVRRLHGWLNRDIADLLPEGASPDARRLAARSCHIGQPVKVSRDGRCVGALRLSAGARTVTRIASDPALGTCPDERLDRQIAEARLVFDKIDLIVGHWAALAQTEDSAPSLRQ